MASIGSNLPERSVVILSIEFILDKRKFFGGSPKQLAVHLGVEPADSSEIISAFDA